MNARTLARARTAAFALCLAGGGLLSMPAAPARAGVFDTPQLRTQVSFSASGPGVCTASAVGPSPVGPVPFATDGVPVTTTGTWSRTYTNDGDGTDVTKLDTTMTSTVAVTGTPTALSGIKFHSASHSTVTSSLGTAQQCGVSATTITFATFSFDLATSRAVTIDAAGAGTAQVVFQRSNPLSPPEQVNLTFAGSANADGHVVKILPPGTWSASLAEQSQIAAPKPGSPTTSVTGEVDAEVVFSDPGVATGPPAGDGARYLKTADRRSCAAGALTATWKAKAGKGKTRNVKKAIFLVNDERVATARKPKKGTVTTLTGLTAGRPADLEVRILLARKGAGIVKVERSYIIC